MIWIALAVAVVGYIVLSVLAARELERGEDERARLHRSIYRKH